MSNEMMSQNEWVTTLSLVSLVYWCVDIHPRLAATYWLNEFPTQVGEGR
jgi:hypothetical protein